MVVAARFRHLLGKMVVPVVAAMVNSLTTVVIFMQHLRDLVQVVKVIPAVLVITLMQLEVQLLLAMLEVVVAVQVQ